jgi:hypothetical protein
MRENCEKRARVRHLCQCQGKLRYSYSVSIGRLGTRSLIAHRIS